MYDYNESAQCSQCHLVFCYEGGEPVYVLNRKLDGPQACGLDIFQKRNISWPCWI